MEFGTMAREVDQAIDATRLILASLEGFAGNLRRLEAMLRPAPPPTVPPEPAGLPREPDLGPLMDAPVTFAPRRRAGRRPVEAPPAASDPEPLPAPPDVSHAPEAPAPAVPAVRETRPRNDPYGVPTIVNPHRVGGDAPVPQEPTPTRPPRVRKAESASAVA